MIRLDYAEKGIFLGHRDHSIQRLALTLSMAFLQRHRSAALEGGERSRGVTSLSNPDNLG